MRFWAAGHLHKNVDLVTSGPYRFTRNPLYLGRLLIFSGLAVMARLPWGLNLVAVLPLGWAVFFLYYLPRKERVEPARLAELHGEALEIQRRFVRGAAVFGGFVGLSIMLRLLTVSVWRRRSDYEADAGRCLACARCFAYCPEEQERLNAGAGSRAA